MRRPLAFIALGLTIIACNKEPANAKGAEASEDPRARVERLCNGMNRLSLAYVAGAAELEVDSLDQEAERAKVKEACKALPLTLVECADSLALDDPRCDAALGKQLGMTDTTPQGKGPAPRWALTLPFELYDLEPSTDGSIAVAGKTDIALVNDGTVVWTRTLDDASSRVGWWKDGLLTGDGGELRCYDAKGDVRWTTVVDDGDDAWLSGIKAGPEGSVLVVTGRGAIVRIDGDQCAAGAEGCTTPLGTVEALVGMQVAVLPSGAIVGSNDDGIVLVSASGALLSRRSAEFEASVPRGPLIIAGKDILRARPDCTQGNDDCFETVASDKDLELTAPVELPGVGIAYADTFGVIHMVGTAEWKIDAGNDADLVGRGSTLYSVGHELGLGEALERPPRLRAIDARTGKTQWLTELGTERAGLLSGYLLASSEQDLLVATKTQLFAIPWAAG